MSPDRDIPGKKPAIVDLRNSQEVYDRDAEAFANKAPRLLTWHYIGRPTFTKHLADEYTAETTILDVGSASGRVPQMHIENGAQAINITGVEISPDQVEIAKQNIPNATFYVGDIRVFPLPSETFDVATSNMVWEFLDDEGLEAGFRNVHGSLKPGGKLVTITTHPNRYIGKHGVTEPGWVNTKGPWNSNDERFENWYRTVDRFTELAQEAGFTIAVLEEPFLEIPEDAPDEDKAKFEESFDHFGFPARLVMVAQK